MTPLQDVIDFCRTAQPKDTRAFYFGRPATFGDGVFVGKQVIRQDVEFDFSDFTAEGFSLIVTCTALPKGPSVDSTESVD